MKKKKFPYFRMFPSDFFGSQGVQLLPAEMRAWYALLLGIIWDYDTQYSIPHDAKIVGPLLGISDTRCHLIFKSLLDGPKGGVLQIKKGRIFSQRLFSEKKRANKYSKDKSIKGKKGAKKRWDRV